jgi:hypothetical protein
MQKSYECEVATHIGRMRRLITRWLPVPAVCHPYPLRRMGIIV